MSALTTEKITRILSLTIGVVLVILPFHAFLTVWLASLLGHYTLLRLWKEFVLVAVGLVAVLLLIRDKRMLAALRRHQLFWLIGGYILLVLFLGFTSYIHNQVSGKALAYGVLEDTRYLLFFVLVAGVSARDVWLIKHWKKLILIPAAIVIVFGLLEVLVLPNNFLQHFGYSLKTIPAIETVNSNSQYIRAQSTLRGANPLGAYLVLVLSVIAILTLRAKTQGKRIMYIVFGLPGLATLFFSYSRGAWIGTIVSLTLALFILASIRLRQWLAVIAGVVLIIAGLAFASLHNNTRFENLIFHSSPHTVATTSDQNHGSALHQGLNDLMHDPLGRGPGTAGPTSVYNRRAQPRIAENYFIQIGQEMGWLGLVIFVLINVWLGLGLWQDRKDSLSLIMFVSLIGLSIVGLVSYVWADDTLCYIWWGLAGISFSKLLKA